MADLLYQGYARLENTKLSYKSSGHWQVFVPSIVGASLPNTNNNSTPRQQRRLYAGLERCRQIGITLQPKSMPIQCTRQRSLDQQAHEGDAKFMNVTTVTSALAQDVLVKPFKDRTLHVPVSSRLYANV